MFKVNDWKIGTRIAAGFAALILIICIMNNFVYTRVRSVEQKAEIVSNDSVPAITALSGLNLRVHRAVNLLTQHTDSSSQTQMAMLEAEIQTLRDQNAKDIEKYESLPKDSKEKDLYAKMNQDRAAFWPLFEDIRKLSREGTPQANAQAHARLTNELIPLVNRYGDALQEVVNYNIQDATTGMKEVNEAVSSAKRGMGISLLLVIVLSVAISIVIVRSITKPLTVAVQTLEQVADGDLTAGMEVRSKDEIGQMAAALNSTIERLNQTLQEVARSATAASSSSQQLAAASEAIASGAQEQAASLEETSASLEEITATVRQSADNAGQASQLALKSKDSATQGQEVVAKAISAMEEINAASAKISDIISTIDEIAFQTNLLAVNAAVEAARAGEEGRGFAVVATEVRSLAQRSAVAAKEIKVLIQDSLRKVEAGSVLVNRSGDTLTEIVNSVKHVTDIVGEIAAAAAEQSSGIEQVNKAMIQMDQVTQSNSAQTEELSATATSMADQAANALSFINSFKLTQEKGGRQAGQHRNSVVHSINFQESQSSVASASPARPGAPMGRAAYDKSVSASKVKSLQPALAAAMPASSSATDDSFEEF